MENLYNIKLKRIYDDIKINDPEHINMPNFIGIKTQLYNKSITKDIENIKDIDINSDYFKIINGDTFLIYNNDKILSFQSNIQAKIMFDNPNDIFIDGTFYSAPKCIYQILTIRVNTSNSNKYFITCFILSLNKTEEIYKKIFYEINKNLIHKFKSKIYKPKRIHIDV